MHCGAVMSPIQMRRMKAFGTDPEGKTDSLPALGKGRYDLPLGPGPNGWAKNRVNISRICSGFWGIDPNHIFTTASGDMATATLSICCCIRAITASCIGLT
jgi:hypothetical protein